tara:strand:+ start:11141 stop:11782 length:642 start_codon:yes stop_codon:yes gene_type:complete
MTLKLNGSSSGFVAIDAPAAAGGNTLVLPPDNGSNGEFLQTNGSGTLDWAAVSSGFETEEYDEWRLTTSFTGAVNPLTNNLERPDTNSFEKIGTGVSQSSGVWTFPNTGKWLITTNSAHYKQSTVARWPGSIHYTTVDNGSNWVEAATGWAWMYYASNSAGNTVTLRTLFDCTDTSTHKFKWAINDSDGETTTTVGDTGANKTYISFWKIGST